MVDKIVKSENDNSSIGLILCRENNRIIAQYALDGINKPIGISSYKLKEYLPTKDEINKCIHLTINE